MPGNTSWSFGTAGDIEAPNTSGNLSSEAASYLANQTFEELYPGMMQAGGVAGQYLNPNAQITNTSQYGDITSQSNNETPYNNSNPFSSFVSTFGPMALEMGGMALGGEFLDGALAGGTSLGGYSGLAAGTTMGGGTLGAGASGAGALGAIDVGGGGGAELLSTAGGTVDASAFGPAGGSILPQTGSILGTGATAGLFDTGAIATGGASTGGGLSSLLSSLGLGGGSAGGLTASGLGSLASGTAGIIEALTGNKTPDAATTAALNPFQGQPQLYQPQLQSAVTGQTNLLATGGSPAVTNLTNSLNTAGSSYVNNSLAAQGLMGSGNAALQQGQFAAGNYNTAFGAIESGNQQMIGNLSTLSGANISPATIAQSYPNSASTAQLTGNAINSLTYGAASLAGLPSGQSLTPQQIALLSSTLQQGGNNTGVPS